MRNCGSCSVSIPVFHAALKGLSDEAYRGCNEVPARPVGPYTYPVVALSLDAMSARGIGQLGRALRQWAAYLGSVLPHAELQPAASTGNAAESVAAQNASDTAAKAGVFPGLHVAGRKSPLRWAG